MKFEMQSFYKTLMLLCLYAPASVWSQCSQIKVKSDSDLSQYANCQEADSVEISGPSIKKVAFPNLKSTKSIVLNGNAVLESFSVPQLSELESLQVVGNPVLGSLSFSGTLKSLKVVDITNNGISKLQGIDASELESLSVAVNKKLVSFESKQLQKLEGYLYVSGNGEKFSFSVPNLQSISGNVTINNCSSVDITNLKSVANSVTLSGNSFANLSLPALEKIEQFFSVISNSELTSISAPKLESVGGEFQMVNNSKLESASAPSLKSVSGSLDINGNLKKISMPMVGDIGGTVNIESLSSEFDCKSVSNIKASAKGGFNCQGGVSELSNSTKNASSNSSSNKSGKDDSSGASSYLFAPLQLLYPSILALAIWTLN